jgi:hypothetical protein
MGEERQLVAGTVSGAAVLHGRLPEARRSGGTGPLATKLITETTGMTRGRRRARPETNRGHGVAHAACAPWPAANARRSMWERGLQATVRKCKDMGRKREARRSSPNEKKRDECGSGMTARAWRIPTSGGDAVAAL